MIPGEVSGRLNAYQRVDIRHSVDIALVYSAVGVELSEGKVQLARIALGAVAPTVIRVTEAEAYLQGRTLSEEVLDKAENLAEAAAMPISDVRAPRRSTAVPWPAFWPDGFFYWRRKGVKRLPPQ